MLGRFGFNPAGRSKERRKSPTGAEQHFTCLVLLSSEIGSLRNAGVISKVQDSIQFVRSSAVTWRPEEPDTNRTVFSDERSPIIRTCPE